MIKSIKGRVTETHTGDIEVVGRSPSDDFNYFCLVKEHFETEIIVELEDGQRIKLYSNDYEGDRWAGRDVRVTVCTTEQP